MANKVFLDGRLVDCGQAHLTVSESGFLYGAGLFETMRSRDGVVFRLQDHLDRLFCSADALAIHHSYEKPDLGEAISELLKANDLREARLRLTLTNGPLAESEDQRKPTLLITATEFRPYPAEHYTAGVLVVLSPFRQSSADPTCGHKTICYYPRLLALNLARRKGAIEALWFTTDNRLAEGCVSNVFVVKSSVLYTPPVETPVLPGIARKAIRQLAQQQSVEMVEKDLDISDLLDADEVFLTNVIMEVLPVIQVEKRTIGDGKVGPVAARIRRSFLAAIDDECRRQS